MIYINHGVAKNIFIQETGVLFIQETGVLNILEILATCIFDHRCVTGYFILSFLIYPNTSTSHGQHENSVLRFVKLWLFSIVVLLYITFYFKCLKRYAHFDNVHLLYLRVFYRNIDYTHMSWPTCNFTYIVTFGDSCCKLIVCHNLCK